MKKSKSALFLMELIIVVLFFALTSAVCLQVFVKAHNVELETKNINHAIEWGDNLSEIFYEYNDNQDRIASVIAPEYKFANGSDGSYIILLDRDYANTENIDDAFFKVMFKAYSDDSFYYLDYSFTDINNKKTVFEFTYKTNIQEVYK